MGDVKPLAYYTALIREAYSGLGYSLGWEFLYTPAATLRCPNGFMLVGINPGGDAFGVAESVEEGNAYLIQEWSPDGARLQQQVRSFFSLLSDRFLGHTAQGDALLGQTLTTNFCPFRSPTWRELPRRRRPSSSRSASGRTCCPTSHLAWFFVWVRSLTGTYSIFCGGRPRRSTASADFLRAGATTTSRSSSTR